MKHWTLNSRIAAGFAGLCAGLALLSGLAIYQMQRAADGAEAMHDLHTEQGALAEKMAGAASEFAIAVCGFDAEATPAN